MSAGRAFLLVAGVMVAFIAAGLGVGGASLVWAGAVTADEAGYVSSGSYPFSSQGHAITAEHINLHSDVPGDWIPWIRDLDVRVDVETVGREPVFVGIARSADVDRYLDGVRHDEIVELRDGRVRYGTVTGEHAPSAPAGETFWTAQEQGRGTQSLSWRPQSGSWSAVVMNADGSAGVDVRARVAADTGILLPIGIGLLVAALVLFGVAVALLAGAASPAGPPVPTAGQRGAPAPPSQPVGAGSATP
jgi:hypothetical protein